MVCVPPHQRNLLRRYHLLLKNYQTLPVEISLPDVAATLACSPRYARSLLKEMQEIGWISWYSHAGRGAQGCLQCRVDKASLESMYEAKVDVDTVISNEMIPFNTNYQPTILSHGFHYHISFYRPVMPVRPTPHSGRGERHLMQMVHAGLTRWLPGASEPVPGIAHTIQVSPDGLIWRFHIRRALIWHNGEPVRPEQLAATLQARIGSPALPYVRDVIHDGHEIRLLLSQCDGRLAHRLASPFYALAHPDDETIGLGPFLVSEHSDHRIVLTQFPGWYGETTQVEEVVFDTQLRPIDNWNVVQLNTSHSLFQPGPRVTKESLDAFFL